MQISDQPSGMKQQSHIPHASYADLACSTAWGGYSLVVHGIGSGLEYTTQSQAL